MKQQILKLLEENGIVEMESKDGHLVIFFDKFRSERKEFIFQLNAQAVNGCVRKNKAARIIDDFINNGFSLMYQEVN